MERNTKRLFCDGGTTVFHKPCWDSVEASIYVVKEVFPESQPQAVFLPSATLNCLIYIHIFLMRTLLLEWRWYQLLSAAAAAKSCQTLCDPMDGSPPGSLVPGILQLLSRTLQTLRDTEPTAQGRVCYPRNGGGHCHHSAVKTLTFQGISTLTDVLVPDPQ